MIERAAGRRDDDVGAAAERADLLIHRRAAVERAPRVSVVPFAYLCTASATCMASSRVGTRIRPRAPPRLTGLREPSRLEQPMEQRQRERRRLAGAGAGLADEVACPRSSTGMASRWIGVGSS